MKPKLKTRSQMIIEEREKLILQAVKDGFQMFEVAKIFKITEGRISQLLKRKEDNGN